MKGGITLTEIIRQLEEQMWLAAKNTDSEAFLKVVDENAVMVCGGMRLSGGEYAQIIAEFDCAEYSIHDFEVVAQTADIVQVHYLIETRASSPENSDLAGTFHITSTWKNTAGEWKLIFNMDSRIRG